MPLPRKTPNKGLPARWRFRHGAYSYRVPKGLEAAWEGKSEFVLGRTLPEAYRAWAARLEVTAAAKDVAGVLDRYLLEVVPAKAISTHEGNQLAIRNLRKAFGHFALTDVRPIHIYQYADKRTAKISGHREVEILSHVFTKAVQWGYIERHPFKGEVRFENEKARNRYVTDDEIVEVLRVRSVRKRGSVKAINAYVRIKLLTGLRRGDLLRLRIVDAADDGLHVQPRKTAGTTGKRIIYERSAELDAAIEMAKAARPVDISPWLFCNRDGECYFDEETGKAPGWKSMWQRFMARVLAETKVSEPFTEHDLRAKCASDATTLEHARALLAHADSRTTDRIYRRKPERVKPLR